VEIMGKVRKVLMCVMLVITLVPLTSALNQRTTPQNAPENTKFQTFNNCYVTLDGNLTEHDYPCIIGTHMWKIMFLRPDPQDDHAAFVLYWLMRIASDAQLTIYAEQNGEILYQHEGTLDPEMRMVSFKGIYYWEDMCHISGTASFVLIRERVGY
jgi:hypothetical protein